jgi:hypothetical protein
MSYHWSSNRYGAAFRCLVFMVVVGPSVFSVVAKKPVV